MHLVVFLTYRMSLAKWDAAGLLDRELTLYRRLAAEGVRVTLVSYGGNIERRYAARIAPVEVVYNRWNLPRRWYAHGVAWLHRRLWLNCDLIKTNQMDGADMARAIAARFKKPLIARCGYLWSDATARMHGAASAMARRARGEEDRGFAAADRIVVTTQPMADHVAQRFPAKRPGIVVIPNGVDTKVFRPVTAGGSPVDLVFVGRVAAEKNLRGLLQAMRGSDLRLLVIGEGQLKSPLQVEFRDLAEQIDWRGRVPNGELPSQLARAKLFVLPSLFEGHPKALLEAMACGLPVIAADQPGLRDAVRHGETGWLCPGTPSGFRQAIDQLLLDAPLRERLAAAARHHVTTALSMARMAADELALYQQLIKERAGAREARTLSRDGRGQAA